MHASHYDESVNAFVASVRESVDSAETLASATNSKHLLQQLRDGLDALDAELHYWIVAAEKTNLALEHNAASLAPQAQLQWRFVTNFRPYLDSKIPITDEDIRRSNLQRWIDTYAPKLTDNLISLTKSRAELIAELSVVAESDRDPLVAALHLEESLAQLRQAQEILRAAVRQLFPTTIPRIEQTLKVKYVVRDGSIVGQMGPNGTIMGSMNVHEESHSSDPTRRSRWKLLKFDLSKWVRGRSTADVSEIQNDQQEKNMEPVSLIIAALVTGASAALEDTASEAIKDAYSALKSKIKNLFESKRLATTPLENPKAHADEIKSSIETSDATFNTDIIDESNRVLLLSASDPKVETVQVKIDGNGKVMFIGNNNVVQGDANM